MRKLIVLSVMLFLGSVTFAQMKVGFGPKFNMNIANLTSSDGNARVGIGLGAFANLRFNDYVALQPELLFSMQGAKGSGTTIKYNYFKVPMMVKAYLFKGLNIELGPELNFLVNPRIKSEGITVDLTGSKHVELAIGVGLGYEFESGLTAGFRYNAGLTKVYKYADWKNSVFEIGIGWKFSL